MVQYIYRDPHGIELWYRRNSPWLMSSTLVPTVIYRSAAAYSGWAPGPSSSGRSEWCLYSCRSVSHVNVSSESVTIKAEMLTLWPGSYRENHRMPS